MIYFLLTLLLLYLLWYLIRPYAWPRIQNWLIKRATRKMYEQFGATPPGGEEKKSRKYSRHKQQHNPNEHIIPEEYAEDVEFTEVKQYSETSIDDKGNVSYHTEEQVTDVDFEIIKDK